VLDTITAAYDESVDMLGDPVLVPAAVAAAAHALDKPGAEAVALSTVTRFVRREVLRPLRDVAHRLHDQREVAVHECVAPRLQVSGLTTEAWQTQTAVAAAAGACGHGGRPAGER
jgi:hypothetical protein